MKNEKSKKLFDKAINLIPGGVNSPVRSFKSVNMNPLFISKAKGSKIIDADGNIFIDYVGSWGPMLLGHGNKRVINKIKKALNNGTSFGAPTEKEIELAEIIINSVKSIESVRLVNSGTEAAMSAIRLARAYTKKNKIIKFEGCYHGHADSFLIKAGSGLTTFNSPSSPGVTNNNISDTLIARYNDIKSVESLFNNDKDIAAVIIEPVPANMGVILPEKDFLKNLESLTKKNNALLIFDEVITGFRLSLGGAQKIYNIDPDITILGKIIGGGLPIGAYGGKKEIMNMISPVGPVYQAGTLSGNPVAVTSGIETLKIIIEENIIDRVNEKALILNNGIKEILNELKINSAFNCIGSISTLFFTDNKVFDYKTVLTSNTEHYAKFFKLMLEQFIYLAPSQFEAMFISITHSQKDIDATLKAFKKALSKERF